MKRQFRWLAAAAIASAFFSCAGTEEEEMGSITGTVTSELSAAPISGATVTTDPATSTATTDADGRYAIADVAAGTYKLIVAKDGFVTRERAGVIVKAGEPTTLSLTLAAATGEATLTVTDGCSADAPLQGATVSRDDAQPLVTGADGKVSLAALAPGQYALRVRADAFLPTTVNVTITAGGKAMVDTSLVCQSRAAADVAREWLGRVTTAEAVVTAANLHARLYDADATNDPRVISVQAAADYARGHIPGAINIGWKAVANEESLALLGDPAARPAGFVNYCYTGHTGGISAAVLNLLGYKTGNMKYGIVSWTRDATVLGTIATPPDLTKDFPTVTTPTVPTATFEPPRLAFAEAETPRDVVKLAARAYLSNPSMAPTITAQALFDNLNDGNPANDPFVISVRQPADYAKGHIAGAINIPWTQIALEENLRKIPTDRDIVVYCYTGHTAGIATGVLGTLGYHRVKNLKGGMASWTMDATVRATTVYSDATDAHDYPLNSGTAP